MTQLLPPDCKNLLFADMTYVIATALLSGHLQSLYAEMSGPVLISCPGMAVMLPHAVLIEIDLCFNEISALTLPCK